MFIFGANSPLTCRTCVSLANQIEAADFRPHMKAATNENKNKNICKRAAGHWLPVQMKCTVSPKHQMKRPDLLLSAVIGFPSNQENVLRNSTGSVRLQTPTAAQRLESYKGKAG